MILIRTKPGTTYQSDHLAGLANDLKVLESLEYEGDVERADGDHVDDIHCLLQEPLTKSSNLFFGNHSFLAAKATSSHKLPILQKM